MKSPLKNNIPICFNNSDTWEVLIGTDKINYHGFLNAASFQSLEEIEQMISCPEYKNISIKLSHNYLWLILMRQKSISLVTKCVAKFTLLLILIWGHNVLQTPAGWVPFVKSLRYTEYWIYLEAPPVNNSPDKLSSELNRDQKHPILSW